MHTSTAIEVKNLSFSYPGSTIALENIELKIYENEFWGIIGPNGGGKSTLLKLILGLLKPKAGSIQIFNSPPNKGRKHIGYVPQFVTFQKNFPIEVFDTVLMGRLKSAPFFFGYSKADRLATLEVLEQFEISHLKHKPISNLSGGQLQKVLIARAFVSKPKVLILDEPTAHVDSHSEEDLFSLLKKHQNDKTIIVVSHDLGFISHYIDHVACINKTLVTDQTEELTSEKLEALYGGHLKTISHSAHDHCTINHSPHKKGGG